MADLDPRLLRLLEAAGVMPAAPAVGYADPTGAALATGVASQPGGFVLGAGGGPPPPTPVSPAQGMIEQEIGAASSRLEQLRRILSQVSTQGQADATQAAIQQELTKVTALEGVRQKFVGGEQAMAVKEGAPTERERYGAAQRLLGTGPRGPVAPTAGVGGVGTPTPLGPDEGGGGGAGPAGGVPEPAGGDFLGEAERTVTVNAKGEPTVTFRGQRAPADVRSAMIALGMDPTRRPTPEQMRAIQQEVARVAGRKKLLEPVTDPAVLTGTGAAYGTPGTEIAGRYIVPEKARDQMAKLGQVRETMKEIERLATQLLTADETNPLAQKAQLVQLHTVAGLGAGKLGTAAKMFQSTRQAFLGTFARTLAAEVGVLTEGDINRIKLSLQDFSDSRQLSQQKMNYIKQLMNTATAHQRLVASGQVRIDDPTYKRKIEALKQQLAQLDEHESAPSRQQLQPYSGKMRGE